MVFVMWRNRHEPFLKRFRAVSFQTLDEAMKQPGGWGTIADQPDWGRFKFAHTHPNQSNSGLLTLVLMAYQFAKKEYNLSHSDVTQPGFQEWLRGFEKGVARPGGSLTSSTGTLMREMVLRGPSQYDCLLIYENLAIDYLDAARDRWGELRWTIPSRTSGTSILTTSWTSPGAIRRQRAAAGEFLKFLMSAPIQERRWSTAFGLATRRSPLRFPESPFILNSRHGVRIDLPRMCEPPKDEVVQDLLDSFGRIED